MTSRIRTIAVAGLLLFVMAASIQPQYSLATLAPLIINDLDGSHAGFGGLISAMFLVAGLASPLAGAITDRLGARTVLLLFFATVAASLVLLANAGSMAVPMVSAAVGGVALAWSNPVTNGMIVSHVAHRSRGIVLGVKQAGVTFGTVTAGMTLPALALWLGWRRTVWMLALAILAVGFAATLIVLRAGPVERPTTVREAAAGDRPGGWLVSYAFFMGAGIAAMTSYLILYLHEDLLMSLRWAGLVLALHGGISVLARVLVGLVAHRLRNLRAVLLALAATAALAAVLLVVSSADTALLAWLGASLIGLANGWNVVAMYMILGGDGGRSAGAATGLLQRGFYGGFCVSPLAFGAIVEWTSSYDLAWLVVVVAFGSGAVTVAVHQLRSRATQS